MIQRIPLRESLGFGDGQQRKKRRIQRQSASFASASPSARCCKCSGHNTMQQSQCPDVIICRWANRALGPDGRSISRIQWICVWLRLKQTNEIQRKRVTWDKMITSFSPVSAYLSLNTPKRYLLWDITAIQAADGKKEQQKNDVYDKQHWAGQPL